MALLLFGSALLLASLAAASTNFTIGGVLSDQKHDDFFRKVIAVSRRNFLCVALIAKANVSRHFCLSFQLMSIILQFNY